MEVSAASKADDATGSQEGPYDLANLGKLLLAHCDFKYHYIIISPDLLMGYWNPEFAEIALISKLVE